MTTLLLPTLAAFAALAIIIILLIRTTRLRLWQGVVIFLLPLLLANVLWFSWLQPQRQQQALEQQAFQHLSQAPGYRVLKEQEPELWSLLLRELVHKMRTGTPVDTAIGQLRDRLADVINQRMARASDVAVVNYIKVSIEEMQALQRQSPQLCFRFLYPQVSGGVSMQEALSPALNQQDALAMEKLLLSSTGKEQTIDQTQAKQDLQQVVKTLYARWGDRLQQLNMPADTAVDRSSLCSMSVDLYSAILALPDKHAANLLRRMVALSG